MDNSTQLKTYIITLSYYDTDECQTYYKIFNVNSTSIYNALSAVHDIIIGMVAMGARYEFVIERITTSADIPKVRSDAWVNYHGHTYVHNFDITTKKAGRNICEIDGCASLATYYDEMDNALCSECMKKDMEESGNAIFNYKTIIY